MSSLNSLSRLVTDTFDPFLAPNPDSLRLRHMSHRHHQLTGNSALPHLVMVVMPTLDKVGDLVEEVQVVRQVPDGISKMLSALRYVPFRYSTTPFEWLTHTLTHFSVW